MTYQHGWTEKKLQDLQARGLIRGYSLLPKKKQERKIIIQKKGKGFYWIVWNLEYFAKERGLTVTPEYQFHHSRRFRFDWAFVDQKIAIEYEGIFSDKSGHTTLGGYIKDTEKYNLAVVNGWTVIRVTANRENYKTLIQQLKILFDGKQK